MDRNSTRGAPSSGDKAERHQSLIVDQFTRQAVLFAASPATPQRRGARSAGRGGRAVRARGDARRRLRAGQRSCRLCPPGATQRRPRCNGRHAAAGAPAFRRPRLGERGAAPGRRLPPAVCREPFDIVTCRFAFHHFQEPEKALAEMVRVCRPGGRVVLCDGVASDDPAKAGAFNRMERHRDPSTVEFRPLAFHLSLFAGAACPRRRASIGCCRAGWSDRHVVPRRRRP